MSIPSIQPRALFGLHPKIIQNAHFVTDAEILYPAGAVLVLHDYSEKRQRYIKLMEKSVKMELITISPNRTMCAVIENGEKGQIYIYDLQTLKRIRTLGLPADSVTKRFEWINFSFDEKLIMAITGDPDCMMLAFNWERGKIETSTRANYLTNPTPVDQLMNNDKMKAENKKVEKLGLVVKSLTFDSRNVICSPVDSAVLLLIGPGLFRLMSMQETVWRQYGFQKAEHLDISSACFLGGDRVLCGTTDGLLLLVDIGELKFTFNATEVTFINAKAEKEELAPTASGAQLQRVDSSVRIKREGKDDKVVRSLIAFSKGFAFACKPGYVHFFEKISAHKYQKRNVYRIDDPDFREIQTEELNIVKHLSVSPSETKLLATTNRSQIYVVKLWGPDINTVGEVPFKHLGESIHHGPITGLAICSWKPIFMTCGGLDRTVRVWNYETEALEMMKQYQEDIHSVSLHPTGLFAAVGFSDKLRFMIVLIDDIQLCREFPIRECTLTAFSSNGQFLAAVNKNIIQVYSCISFQNMWNLKGHNGQIMGLMWTPDDKKLVSCGQEGAVYEWDMTIAKRIGEVVNKGISYWDCSITSDGKFIYAVGNDGLLKEITESNIARAIDLGQSNLDHIAVAKSDLMMFVAGDRGSVLSIKMPLSEPAEYSTFYYHSSKILQMKLSFDDRTLITCSQAGVLSIWKLAFSEGKTIVLDKDFSYFNEILISKTDLEEKISSIKDLTQRTHELEMEHTYQMRQTESAYADRIKDIHDTYCQAIEELKNKIEILESNHNAELNNINTDINLMKERHEASMLEMEAKYNSQLIVEYDKYLTLEDLKKRMREEYETRLSLLEKSKEATIEELTKAYESKLFNLNKMLEESQDEIKKEINEHEEIKNQIEEDDDREIEEMRIKYEEMMKNEKETNIRLRGEAGVMKKKYLTSQKDIDTFRMEIIHLKAEHQKFKSIIKNLEKDIQALKKEISERDLTIQEKERRIYDLKKRHQELERYKYVYNYRIKELKNQLEPRDKEIKEKKEQIIDMELELEDLQKINVTLDVNLSAQREKLSEAYSQVHKSKERYLKIITVIKHIKVDIYTASGYIQDYKKLKDGIRQIYRKYITDKDFIKGRKGDEECLAEFARQREYLERIVDSLKTKVEKSRHVKYGENLLYMETNWSLMDEIYKLRRELKIAQRKVQDMEALLCLRTAKIHSPRLAHKLVQEALKSQDEVQAEVEIKMEEATQKTALMKEEVTRLLERITALERAIESSEEGELRRSQTFDAFGE